MKSYKKRVYFDIDFNILFSFKFFKNNNFLLFNFHSRSKNNKCYNNSHKH